MALAMQEHERWPRGDKRSAETLANKLRDLDKGKDAAWWFGTGHACLPALAAVLDESVDDLEGRIASAVPEESFARRHVFSGFPELRPLSLSEEPLPPGYPAAIVGPRGPQADLLWWTAPRGSGAELVGEWLQARFNWRVVRCERWDEVCSKLGERRGQLVLLDDASGAELNLLSVQADRPVCVVCRMDPPRPPLEEGQVRLAERLFAIPEPLPAGWVKCATPPPARWLSALIDWCAARIESGGGFDALAVRAAAVEGLFDGFLDTLEGALTFFGVVERLGAAKLFGSDEVDLPLERIVGDWVGHAARQAERAIPHIARALLRKEGAEILIAMETQRLRTLRPGVLTEAEWMTLVPASGEAPVDAASLLQELDGVDGVEAVRQALASDPRAIVHALRVLGALVPANGALEWGHGWLASILRQAGLSRLWSDGGLGIGAALLNPEIALPAMEALLDAVTEDPDQVRVAASAGVDTPEGAASVNGAFRAVGLAIARGEEVDAELASMVWHAQAAGLGRRIPNWPALPVVGVSGSMQAEFPLQDGAWTLAALTLSRRLARLERGEAAADWDVWADAGLPPAFSRESLDVVLSNLWWAAARGDGRWEESAWVLATCRMGGALLDHAGVVGAGRLAYAQAADALVLLAAGRLPESPDFVEREVLRLPCGLPAVLDACERRGVAFDQVIQWCWERWGSGGSQAGVIPPIRWPFGRGTHGEGALRSLWRDAPVELVSDGLLEQLQHHREVWPYVPDALWARWLDRVWRDTSVVHDLPDYSGVPAAVIVARLRREPARAWGWVLVRKLWEQLPAELAVLAWDLIRDGDAARAGRDGLIAELVSNAPDAHRLPFLEASAVWLADAEAFPHASAWVPRWWLSVIEQRAAGWREAFGYYALWRDSGEGFGKPAATGSAAG